MSKKEKKKSGLGTWFYRLVMLALLCVMIFSGYKVFTIYMEYHKGTVAYDDLAKIAGAGESADKEEKDLTIDWDALTKISKMSRDGSDPRAQLLTILSCRVVTTITISIIL